MKHRYILFTLILFLLLFVSTTVSLLTSGIVIGEEDKIVLANFEDNYVDVGFDTNNMTAEKTSEISYSKPYSMNITYTKLPCEEGWQAFGFELPSSLNLSGYSAISIQVYGTCSISALLDIPDTPQPYQYIGLRSSTKPDTWNQLIWDLSTTDVDISNVTGITFVIEDEIGSAKTFYLDDIELTKMVNPQTGLLANFEDNYVDLKFWTGGVSEKVSEKSYSEPYSMKTTYMKLPDEEGWQGIDFELPSSLDLSDYSAISIRVYGTCSISAWIGTGITDQFVYLGLRSSTEPNIWNRLVWDLSTTDVNLSKITGIVFVMEDEIGTTRTFYLDDIELTADDSHCFIPLTTDSARDWKPSWSHDGNEIVFISTRAHSRPDIWVMDAGGNNEELLLGGSDTYESPSYKPSDDSKILFRGYIPYGSGSSIWTMNPDASVQTRIRYDPGYDFYGPCWSPDGLRIAYHGSPRYSAGIDEIYLMNPNGTGSIKLTDNEVYDGFATWSPDGSNIAFVSNRSGKKRIWIMNADGSNPIDTGINSELPKWSPIDVDKIAFTSTRSGNCDIWLLTNAQEVMSGVEPKVAQLTRDSANDGGKGFAWSPDGNKIVFSADRNRSENFDIWLMDVRCARANRIEVSPLSVTMTVAGTQQFIANAKDQNGDPMLGIVIAWTSSNTAVGTVNPASSITDSDGKATTTFSASAIGTTTVKAESGTVNGTACVTVQAAELVVFDTRSGTYPSVMGIHTGTIKPDHDVSVSKLYTYPCSGTGGHTEYIRIYGNEINKSASWKGYVNEWHTITFDDSFFILEEGKTYDYVIKTGSYPQIHHTSTLLTDNGWINCTTFTDSNGKRYHDWIPAIKLFH